MVRAISKFGGVHPLPPGQAKIWAEKARNGEAEESAGGFYIFKNKGGAKEIVIISIDPPDGYMKR